MGGQQARVPARQQARVERLHRQPLEVHDVGTARPPRVAQHPRHVLEQPGQPARAVAARLPRIEGLDQLESRGRRQLAVGEAARDQLDVGARARARRRGRGRRAACRPGGRRRGRASRCASIPARWSSSPTASSTPSSALLQRGLDAIARERAAVPFETEVLVLDNGSRDGSAEAARAHPTVTEVIALTNGAARARTTRRCCSAPAGASRCCSTRTPSCWRGRRRRCTQRSRRTRAPAPRAPGCCGPTAARSPRPGASPPRAPPRCRRSSCTAASWSRAAGTRSARSTGRSRPRCSCARGGADRLVRPRLLRLLRRGRLRQAPARRRLARPARPRRAGDPSRAALHRLCRRGGSSSSPATATSTCASTMGLGPRARCAG